MCNQGSNTHFEQDEVALPKISRVHSLEVRGPEPKTGQRETTTEPTSTALNWVKPFCDKKKYIFSFEVGKVYLQKLAVDPISLFCLVDSIYVK